MANVKLPKKIDPIKSAQKRSSYDGIYFAHEMKRFTSAVASAQDEVPVKVEFLKDAQGLTLFKGEMASDVQLICQRCNQLLDHSVQTEYCYTPVQGHEQTDQLPDAYEPVQVNDHGEIDLLQIIEDEIILALPLVAMHDEQDCKRQSDKMSFGKVEPAEERPNPFAVLKELKRDEE